MRRPFDLVIRNGIAVTAHGTRSIDIGIENGVIVALLQPDSTWESASEIDATGLLVTPGGIDTHTHVHWPHDDVATVDDFAGATRAAVLGGTTTLIDFVPPGTGDLLERCHDRVDEALAGGVIDFSFHPILTSADEKTTSSIDRVVRDGFTSFKMYTTYEDRRIDDGAAWWLMRAIAASGGVSGFHAENHELLESILKRQVHGATVTVGDFPTSRPALAEAEAIQMVALYARRLHSPVYIFHVSGGEALAAVEDARGRGTEIYAETCTHYLVFDRSVFDSPQAWKYVISPPLRDRHDRDELWQGIRDGAITSIGSDHCAYDVRRKHVTTNDHRDIPAGAPGIEARTPMLFSGAVDHGIDVETFSKINAERAAKALGLYPRKGVIAVGSDADLVLWDRDREWIGREAVVAGPGTFSLYDDVRSIGRPKDVVVGGRRVVADFEFVPGAYSGKFLHRRPRMPSRRLDG